MASALEALKNAQERLAPYRGLKGRYREELGAEEGNRLLHTLCGGSPRGATEFLGYAPSSYSNITRYWQALDLPINRRDWSNPVDGWSTAAIEAIEDANQDLDDLEARYLKATSVVERAHEVRWTVDPGTEYTHMICVSDLHYGTRAMDLGRWLKLRDWIGEHPDVRWLFHGDLFDLACSTAPGRAMTEQFCSFEDARRLAEKHILPIASQCAGMLSGNHDQRVAKALQIDFDPVRETCKILRIKYLGYENWVRWSITDGKHKRQYDTYHHHGFGGGRMAGSKANKNIRMAYENHSDAVVMGHTHDLFSMQANSTVIDEEGYKRVVEVPAVNAGSFHKHLGYVREAGYAPSSLGAATLHMYLDRHSVHART